MNRADSGRFFLYLIGIVAILSGVLLAKGGLFLDRHEGDALHLIEIMLRMGQGQWPHLDFVTPLGVAAFLPMSSFVKAGFGIGQSVVLAQALVAVILVPMVFYVARSRMSKGVAFGFATLILVMALALVHGEAVSDVSISMHYNRWAWALAFLAVPVAVLPARTGGSQAVDGIILGLAMSFFILGKVTFAVAFAPVLILGLVMRQAWRAMGAGLGVVVICMAIPTVFLGFGFWQAYIGDILQVASSGIRPRAGVDLPTLLLNPRFVVGNMVLAACIFVLRTGDRPEQGLILFVLAPAFFYVTYQNYGNDPKWLALLAVLMLSFGSDLKYRGLALAAAVLIAPSFVNMATSPFRNLIAPKAGYLAVFNIAPHTDVHTPLNRVNRVQERRTITLKTPEFAALNQIADIEPDVEFLGVTYNACQQELGLLGIMRETAADLRRFGLGDEARIFTADTFGGIWMFGGFAAVKGGAPWYYGELAGFDNSDYLLVPTCPITPRAFKAISEEIEALEDVEFEELRRTELYNLYMIKR